MGRRRWRRRIECFATCGARPSKCVRGGKIAKLGLWLEQSRADFRYANVRKREKKARVYVKGDLLVEVC